MTAVSLQSVLIALFIVMIIPTALSFIALEATEPERQYYSSWATLSATLTLFELVLLMVFIFVTLLRLFGVV